MNMYGNNVIKKIAIGIIGALGLACIVLAAGFFAVKWHWTDTEGIIDGNENEFTKLARRIELSREDVRFQDGNRCKALVIGEQSGVNAQLMMDAYAKTHSAELLANMVEAALLRLTDDRKRTLASCDDGTIDGTVERQRWNMDAPNIFPWMNTEDWQTFKAAVAKDKQVINRVSVETGVEPRLIVAQVVAEQLRLFNSDRDVYKKFFAPLKMLGSETKFSLGVAGVKEETAINIENNLKDRQSPYYPGAQYEQLLDFKTSDIETERYDRLTDEHDHYYAYLYAALYLKEVMQQWKAAGYNISHRPEILSTLYNIGFNHSKPNANPAVGGAQIEIGGAKYSFGSLGYEFYYSGEMMDEFPYGQ